MAEGYGISASSKDLLVIAGAGVAIYFIFRKQIGQYLEGFSGISGGLGDTVQAGGTIADETAQSYKSLMDLFQAKIDALQNFQGFNLPDININLGKQDADYFKKNDLKTSKVDVYNTPQTKSSGYNIIPSTTTNAPKINVKTSSKMSNAYVSNPEANKAITAIKVVEQYQNKQNVETKTSSNKLNYLTISTMKKKGVI